MIHEYSKGFFFKKFPKTNRVLILVNDIFQGAIVNFKEIFDFEFVSTNHGSVKKT